MTHAHVPPSGMLAAIMSRRSIGKLNAPGPDHSQLEEVFQAALSAPDHGQLKPWHFIVIQGDEREKLGQLFKQAYQIDAPAETAQHERVSSHPLRAPVIIIAITKINAASPVPVGEQILSTGAAIENMLLMLDSMNYGAIWRTGFLSESPSLRKLMNLASDDVITGFIYTGTPEKWLEPHVKLPLDTYVSWSLPEEKNI